MKMKPEKINSWYGYAELDSEKKKHFLRIPALVNFQFSALWTACIQIPEHLLGISILIRQSGSAKDESWVICII